MQGYCLFLPPLRECGLCLLLMLLYSFCPFWGGSSAAVVNSLVVFVPQVVIKLLSGVCVCFRCYDKAQYVLSCFTSIALSEEAC